MILEEIAVRTRERVSLEKKQKTLEQMRCQAETLPVLPEFAFEQALRKPGLSFICEIKKASPSKGVIAEDFPYLSIAKEYEEAGADAISVLTEPYYFQGSNQYLDEVTKTVKVPVLRKDFTVDSYMIYQAKTLGASAVLLICTLLEREILKEYRLIAESLGMAALVEAHDENEVLQALDSGAKIIGVNNRDLKTFQVDVNNSVRLRKLIPQSILFVSESGVKGPEDTRKLYENKSDGVLIGETFMRSKQKKEILNQLRMK